MTDEEHRLTSCRPSRNQKTVKRRGIGCTTVAWLVTAGCRERLVDGASSELASQVLVSFGRMFRRLEDGAILCGCRQNSIATIRKEDRLPRYGGLFLNKCCQVLGEIVSY